MLISGSRYSQYIVMDVVWISIVENSCTCRPIQRPIAKDRRWMLVDTFSENRCTTAKWADHALIWTTTHSLIKDQDWRRDQWKATRYATTSKEKGLVEGVFYLNSRLDLIHSETGLRSSELYEFDT
jgi:hypothetical protein